MTAEQTLRIGLDDTDSKKGMCTTYVGAVLAQRLVRLGANIVGFPRLVRLNPNIPWKTRGNCAISLTIRLDEGKLDAARECALNTVAEFAELHIETTNPGVVFLPGEDLPAVLADFAHRAIRDVVRLEEAEALCRQVDADFHKFKLGRGLIGALAAIGNRTDDRTYELIAYRERKNWGTPRRVDYASVVQMDAETYPETFDNLDPASGELRITPHTPCPILFGIRGESPEAVEKAFRVVKPLEPIDGRIVYETNQATDQHILEARISDVKPLTSVKLTGTVVGRPRLISGGHVVFTFSDGTGRIECAAYEPTRSFAYVVSQLAEGDEITVYGGVKAKPGLPLTLNLEKIYVSRLQSAIVRKGPICACGARARSLGVRKGFRCDDCGKRYPEGAAILVEDGRKISPGFYEVPPRARRHLSKPISRLTVGALSPRSP